MKPISSELPLEATKEISLNVLLLVLSILIVNSGFNYSKYQENQFDVVIANRTDNEIKYIKLHSRNALTKIDSLSVNTDTTVVFRGKNINYDTANNYENEITLLYYYNSKWREQPILKGFNRWKVLKGPY